MTFVLLHEFKAEKFLAEAQTASPYEDRDRYRYVAHPVWINMAHVVEMRVAPAEEPSKHRPEGKPASTSLIVPEGGGFYSVAETPHQILQALSIQKADRA